MPKTYSQKVRSHAMTFIVMSGMTADTVSKILEPSASTIERWAEEGNWYEMQELRLSSTIQAGLDAAWQIAFIYRQARNEGRMTTPKEADMIAKHRKNLEGLHQDLAFASNGIEAIGMFMTSLREKDEALHDKLAEFTMEFTQDLYKKVKEAI